MTTDAPPAEPTADEPAAPEPRDAAAPDAAAKAPAAEEVRRHRWQEARDIVGVFLLSATAILTAWCGFQSSKWGGMMSIQFSQASAARVLSANDASEARDARSVDLAIYTQWVDATARGDTKFADYVRARFTPAFAVAFKDWQARGEIRRSPFKEPSYVPAGQVASEAAAKLADRKFAAALDSNQRGDNYSILTVLFALVLFFTATSQRFGGRWAGVFLLSLGALAAVVGGVLLATFPVLV